MGVYVHVAELWILKRLKKRSLSLVWARGNHQGLGVLVTMMRRM